MNIPPVHTIRHCFLPALTCLLLVSSALAGDNLVKNSDFQDGDLLPDYWKFGVGEQKLWEPEQVLERVSYEIQGGADGGRCLLIKTGNEHLIAEQVELQQSLEPGVYRLSAQIKTEGFTEGSPRLAVVNIPFDQWNGYIDIKPGSENDGSRGWVPIETTFRQENEQKGFRITFLNRGANGNIWIDNVRLEKIEN